MGREKFASKTKGVHRRAVSLERALCDVIPAITAKELKCQLYKGATVVCNAASFL